MPSGPERKIISKNNKLKKRPPDHGKLLYIIVFNLSNYYTFLFPRVGGSPVKPAGPGTEDAPDK
jgi:hypothetical protein